MVWADIYVKRSPNGPAVRKKKHITWVASATGLWNDTIGIVMRALPKHIFFTNKKYNKTETENKMMFCGISEEEEKQKYRTLMSHQTEILIGCTYFFFFCWYVLAIRGSIDRGHIDSWVASAFSQNTYSTMLIIYTQILFCVFISHIREYKHKYVIALHLSTPKNI